MARRDRDQLQAYVPKDMNVSFPQQCVCCLSIPVSPHLLQTTWSEQLPGMPGFYLDTLFSREFANVPYCARHSEELEQRLKLNTDEHLAETEKPWLRWLVMAGPPIGLALLGSWLFPNGTWGFLGGLLIGVLAISLPLFTFLANRRVRELTGGATFDRKTAAEFSPGYEGRGGTLGFSTYPRAHIVNVNAKPLVAELDGVLLVFQNADYAALFRAANMLLTPKETKQAKRDEKRKEKEALRSPENLERMARGREAMKLADKGFAELTRMLSAADDSVKVEALRGLMFSNWTEENAAALVGPVLGLLHHPDSEVRHRAAKLLNRFGGNAEVLEAVIASGNDQDVVMRRHAAENLRFFRGPEAIAELDILSNDPDREVRDTALYSLRTVRP